MRSIMKRPAVLITHVSGQHLDGINEGPDTTAATSEQLAEGDPIVAEVPSASTNLAKE
jgi:hypothetical protein